VSAPDTQTSVAAEFDANAVVHTVTVPLSLARAANGPAVAAGPSRVADSSTTDPAVLATLKPQPVVATSWTVQAGQGASLSSLFTLASALLLLLLAYSATLHVSAFSRHGAFLSL
jgi:hypothetical protein